MKYTMHKAEKNEKKPTEPTIQTAKKTEVQEALEILLKDSADSTKRKSLTAQAKVFRKRIDEMEEGHE